MCDTHNTVIYGYWGLRGIGQVGRYLLAYCKVPHQEKRYETYEDWMMDKETIGFDFPNLPYLINGDKKITESLAVFEYIPTLGNKKELLGADDEAKLQMKIASGVLSDVKNEILKLVFGVPKEIFVEEKEKSWTEGILREKLTRLDKYLGKKEYLCGKITVVDFVLFNLCDLLNEMDSGKMSDFPELMAFLKRFAQIPEIKDYRESEKDAKIWFPPELANWTHSRGF